MTKKMFTIPTYHWQPAQNGNPAHLKPEPEPTNYNLDYSDPSADGQHAGMPICKTAFNSLLGEFEERRKENPVFDVGFVTFSKTCLFRILAQAECEQLRFYFAFPEPKHLSLMIEGLTKDGKSLNIEEIMHGDPKELFNDSPTDSKTEEKGNGGNNFRGNVKQVSDIFNKLIDEEKLNFLAEGSTTENKQRLAILLLQAINNL